MKRTIILTLIAFFAYQTGFSNGAAQRGKDVTDNGFYFNIGSLLPFPNYFVPKSMDNEEESSFLPGAGFEIGNVFTLKDNRSSALQLKISWLDGNWSALKSDFRPPKSSFFENSSIFISGLNTGLKYMMAFSDESGLGGYYQIGLGYASFAFDDLNLGLLHTFGLEYTYQSYNFGAKLYLGSLTDMDKKLNGVGELTDDHKIRVSSTKIYVGFNF